MNSYDPANFNNLKWQQTSRVDAVTIEHATAKNSQHLRRYRVNGRRPCALTTLAFDERDVVENVYEGGRTVWHGTLHALNYLAKLGENTHNSFSHKRVIDIGCGNGLLGIYAALTLKALQVTFQDLNADVLSQSTANNLRLNSVSHEVTNLVEGAWPTCFQSLKQRSYSLILTSDTVYRLKHFEALHAAFDALLDEDLASRVLVSGKSLYFGNDGGVLPFADFVRQRRDFEVEALVSDDLAVPHTLLLLKRIQSCG